jgi:hypothetical protein
MTRTILLFDFYDTRVENESLNLRFKTLSSTIDHTSLFSHFLLMSKPIVSNFFFLKFFIKFSILLVFNCVFSLISYKKLTFAQIQFNNYSVFIPLWITFNRQNQIFFPFLLQANSHLVYWGCLYLLLSNCI